MKWLFVLLTSISLAAQADVVRFLLVSENLFRSSQPETATDYALLRSHGIKTLINLRSDDTVPDAKARAEAHGLRQINIPLGVDTTREEYYAATEKIFAALENPELQPVLVHCRHGKDRTGLVGALYRVLYQDWSSQRAFREWRAMGLSDEWGVGIQKFFWEFTENEKPLVSLRGSPSQIRMCSKVFSF